VPFIQVIIVINCNPAYVSIPRQEYLAHICRTATTQL